MRLLALLTLATAVSAVEIGADAPPLESATWIKGEAPDLARQVTVVEFWATWCPPCLESIPHLSQLQDRYGDRIAIVGISNEDQATVKPFVEERGEDMDYAVGIMTGAAYDAYMREVNGIPTAFIVDTEGQIAWKGHPMAMDRALQEIVDGRFDPARAQRVKELEETMQNAIQQGQEIDQVAAAAETLLEVEPTHEYAIRVATYAAKQNGDHGAHRKIFARIPANELDPMTANSLAWQLVTEDDLAYLHLDLARTFADRALAASEDASAAQRGDYLDTAARVAHLAGDIAGAVDRQEQAVGLKPDDEGMKKVLEFYRGLRED